MAVLKLRCPDCGFIIRHPAAEPWPTVCPQPRCRAYFGTDGNDEVCMPFIRSAATKATDKVYRDIERGSETRAEMAASLLGVPVADVSDLKVTNLRTDAEVAHVPVQNDITRLMDAHPDAAIGFQGAGAQYSGAVQTGPAPNAGLRTRNIVRDFHTKFTGGQGVSDRPALETMSPNYRRRG